MTSNQSFRKAVLLHRNALITVWPLAFPKHSFADLHLLPACEPIKPWPEDDLWARAARAYHQERKSQKGNAL